MSGIFHKSLFQLGSAVFVVAMATPSAVASESVSVLNLPLGGKLSYAPKICPLSADHRTKICWIDTPFTHTDGSRRGYAALPGPDSRPKWAAYGMFELSIDRNLVLYEIKVHSDYTERSDIHTSISTRFGPATISYGSQGAKWVRQEITVDLLCSSPKKCYITFRPPPNPEQLQRISEKAKREQSRPDTP